MPELPSLSIAKYTLTKKEKVGQFFMPAAFINDTEAEIQKLENLIRKYHIGGLCFFHSRTSAATNFEGKKKITRNEHSFTTLQKLITRYQNVAKYPLLMAIDAEWGLAMRIENTPQYPYAITLGAIQGNEALIYEVGQQIGHDCKMAGLHWNLAPVVDININPNNPVIGYRSFGDDKIKIVRKASAYVEGMAYNSILNSIKHFPGHGDTHTDSHLGVPVIEKSKEELNNNELFPFRQLLQKGVDAVMVGHLAVPALTSQKDIPSSINKDMITGILRKEMAFTGVVISDALNMHAVSKHYTIPGSLEWAAFDAGNDILCFSENTEKGIETILEQATEKQLEESFSRIWKLKEKVFSSGVPMPVEAATLSDPSELNRKLAKESITLLKGSPTLLAKFRNNPYHTLNFERTHMESDNHQILSSLHAWEIDCAPKTHIRLNLTPPQVKPNNHFGLLPEEIQFINDLIDSKQIVLYIYGNPYILGLLSYEKTVATVIVYQDFPEFKEIANDHFVGKILAKGVLPVTLA